MSTGPPQFVARRPAAPRRLWRRREYRLVIAAILLLVATALCAAAGHRVGQKGRAFSLSQITIARGDTVLFSNDDEFLHQIYVDSPNMSFDSDEQPPGQTIQVNFPRSGTFPVRCHIHPKMLLTVLVE
jgi:plastocyanin